MTTGTDAGWHDSVEESSVIWVQAYGRWLKVHFNYKYIRKPAQACCLACKGPADAGGLVVESVCHLDSERAISPDAEIARQATIRLHAQMDILCLNTACPTNRAHR